jgi:hypothetical protein
LGERDPTQEERRRGNAFLVTDLLLECEAFLKQWVNPRRLGLGRKQRASPLRQGGGYPTLITQLLEERHAFLKQSTGSNILTLLRAEQSQGKERPGDAALIL